MAWLRAEAGQQIRRHGRVEAVCGQAFTHHQARLLARHVGRHDGQAVLQRQGDVGAVERPVPAPGADRGDQRVGIR
jgi:hypothetical protein